MIVAPGDRRGARASTPHGISDDLLTATLLATRAPVLVAPAMHTEMWEHPAVQENLATLRRRGVHVVDPESGRLAGGDVGAGRLADPGVDHGRGRRARPRRPGRPRRGPGARDRGRHPRADRPVRFIGNRSSGKMGYAIAEAGRPPGRRRHPGHHHRPAARRRASRSCRSQTAAEMQDAVHGPGRRGRRGRDGRRGRRLPAEGAAARKLKKDEGIPEIVLEPTPDILAELGRGQAAGQVLVGFAAETERPGGARRREAAPQARSTCIVGQRRLRSPTPASRSTPTGRSSLTPTAAIEATPLLAKIRPRRGRSWIEVARLLGAQRQRPTTRGDA